MRNVTQSRDLVSAHLHRTIADADPKHRATLIALRRDAFNGRWPAIHSRLSENVESDAISGEIVGLLMQQERAERALANGMQDLTLALERQLEEGRNALSRFAHTPAIAHGVALASESLVMRLQKYTATGSLEPRAGKQGQLERGLLRYAVRAATKATPFATFCVTGHVVLGDDPCVGSDTMRTLVAPNRALFGHWWNTWRSANTARERHQIRVNPTLQLIDATASYVGHLKGREHFMRIRTPPAVRTVFEALIDSPARLRREIIEMLPQIAPQDLEAVVDRLLEVDALQVAFPVRDTSRWLEQLAAPSLTARSDGSSMEPVIAKFVTAIQHLSQPSPNWLTALDACRLVATEFMREVSDDLGIPRGMPVYVDQYRGGGWRPSNEPAFVEAVQEMRGLASIVATISVERDEQATARAVFDRHAAGRRSLPLLEYYELYSRVFRRAYLEASGARGWASNMGGTFDSAAANPLGVRCVSQIIAARARILDFIAKRWNADPHTEEITIAPCEVVEMVADLPPLSPGQRSVTAFFQCGQRNGSLYTVLKHASFVYGWGKFHTRFLEGLDSYVTQRLAHRMLDDLPGQLAEVPGATFFNGDAHPPLTRYVIELPSADSVSGRANDQHVLRCQDLTVEVDPTCAEGLVLMHRTRGRIIPIDTGFLTQRARTPLQQLLGKFGLPAAGSLPLPLFPNEGTREQALGVFYRPRIVFGRHIVLARRRWYVRPGTFPVPQVGERRLDFLLRIESWRVQYGLPVTSFVHTVAADPVALQAGPVPSPSEEGSDAAEDKCEMGEVSRFPSAMDNAHAMQIVGVSNDDVKPQFIAFDSPLLIDILMQTVRRQPTSGLVFEEVLPTADEMVGPSGGAHATEYVADIDFVVEPKA